MHKKKGFTLMELLVVISIVALLTSILVPALSKAKANAAEVMCSSKLLQLGQIWNLYVIDNDGLFMERNCGHDYGAVSWFHHLEEYHDPNDELIICPQATRTPEEGGRNPYMAWEDTTDFGEYYKGSYGINLWVANGGSCAHDPLDFDLLCWRTPDVRGASYAPLLLCSQWKDMQPHPEDEPREYESWGWTSGWEDEMRRPCIKRHSLYHVNVLFLDFSLDKRTIKELWRLKWHREWPADYALPVWPEWMADVPDPD
ncbi:MAG: type II secretion system protein [Planctomycetota bacterium]|jgi:prepilin-type N-terminal cleavage/methylation domain-containing protein